MKETTRNSKHMRKTGDLGLKICKKSGEKRVTCDGLGKKWGGK